MLRPIRCTRCGNHSMATTANVLAQRILCATCGQEIPLSASAINIDRQGMMRMGDDEGGGDWGGGDESAEDEEEEEGEDGKKKKKKKKGGFFSGLMGKLIAAVVGVVVLGSLCCCVVAFAFFFPSHPLVGEWEKFDSVMAKVKVKDEKDMEVEKEESREVAHKLDIKKTDDKSGTGTYTFTGPNDEDAPKAYTFKWKDWDKDKKTVVFEMDKADDKFWKDIKSPATFNVNAAGNNLELTSGAEKVTFTKVAPPPKEDKGGGKKKRR